MGLRIPPLPRDKWNDEAAEVYCFWEGDAVRETGSRSTLTMTLAQHPALGRAYYPFGKQLLVHSTVPSRQREILTMRIAWLCQCEYEWAHHYRRARGFGITAEQIESLKHETNAGLWSELDLAVLNAVDQLHGRGRIEDHVWAVLEKHFDTRQLMDLVFTIGQYAMLSWAINAFGTQVEEDQEPKAFGHLSDEELARPPLRPIIGAPDDDPGRGASSS